MGRAYDLKIVSVFSAHWSLEPGTGKSGRRKAINGGVATVSSKIFQNLSQRVFYLLDAVF